MHKTAWKSIGPFRNKRRNTERKTQKWKFKTFPVRKCIHTLQTMNDMAQITPAIRIGFISKLANSYSFNKKLFYSQSKRIWKV